jgi:hypothetical protein
VNTNAIPKNNTAQEVANDNEVQPDDALQKLVITAKNKGYIIIKAETDADGNIVLELK